MDFLERGEREQMELVRNLLKEVVLGEASKYWLRGIRPLEVSGDFLDSCLESGIWAVDKIEIGYVTARPSQFLPAVEKLMKHNDMYPHLLAKNLIGPRLADEFMQFLLLGKIKHDTRMGIQDDKRVS